MTDSDAYYDPQTGKWYIDDGGGRKREATEEEIEAANPNYSDDDEE